VKKTNNSPAAGACSASAFTVKLKKAQCEEFSGGVKQTSLKVRNQPDKEVVAVRSDGALGVGR